MSLRLKVVGCGHSVEVAVPPEAPVSTIKAAVEASTGLPACYVRLLQRGKALDDDEATASACGVLDRTKLMLMHTPAYARDAVALEALSAIGKEIDALAAAPAQAREELATQLCCRLDAVEVGDSESLRTLRRQALLRCEQLNPEG